MEILAIISPKYLPYSYKLYDFWLDILVIKEWRLQHWWILLRTAQHTVLHITQYTAEYFFQTICVNGDVQIRISSLWSALVLYMLDML